MMWKVLSTRLPWPAGARLGVGELSACNIDALVQGGHLGPVKDEPKTKRMPVAPVPDDTANEPEEL